MAQSVFKNQHYKNLIESCRELHVPVVWFLNFLQNEKKIFSSFVNFLQNENSFYF